VCSFRSLIDELDAEIETDDGHGPLMRTTGWVAPAPTSTTALRESSVADDWRQEAKASSERRPHQRAREEGHEDARQELAELLARHLDDDQGSAPAATLAPTPSHSEATAHCIRCRKCWKVKTADEFVESARVAGGSEICRSCSTPARRPLPTQVSAAAPSGPAVAYVAFSGRTRDPMSAPRNELVDDLLGIVSVEGPMIGERLHQAYVRASGGQRVGRQIAQQLNQAITYAVSNGRLIEDNPLGESGVKPKTYRLADQPPVRVRYGGPRLLEQIPPSELAAVMQSKARETGWTDSESLYRATLDLYGWVRLTANVVAHLGRIKQLAKPADN